MSAMKSLHYISIKKSIRSFTWFDVRPFLTVYIEMFHKLSLEIVNKTLRCR